MTSIRYPEIMSDEEKTIFEKEAGMTLEQFLKNMDKAKKKPKQRADVRGKDK